jgi:hypothetical protein
MSNDHKHRPLPEAPEAPESCVTAISLAGGQGRGRQRSAARSAMRVETREHSGVRRAGDRNALRAQRRLVALCLLADGRMHPSEVDLLCGPKVPGRLFASETQFLATLTEFCADVRRMPVSGDHYAISPEYVERLLAEVSDPAQRRATLNLMFDVIRSDGRLDRHEAALLWNALDAWGLRVTHLGRSAAGRG